MARRILLVAATTGYQTRSFDESARRLGFDLILATDRCHQLDNPWGDAALPVRFDQPEAAAELLARLRPPPDGIMATGDNPTVLAAAVAERLRLRFHSSAAVALCRDKFLSRERLRESGLPVPEYSRVSLDFDIGEAARAATYPCVLKPLGLSGSRGVIRADDQYDFFQAFQRIRSILDIPDIRRHEEERNRYIQVETYIPGREYALEGLVINGELKVLALFDKPEELDGPFFEETIYVTPSQEPEQVQSAITQATQLAVTALGLTNGPVHAEMRHNAQGVWMLELAARPIGGLCAQALRFGDGMPLEELLLRFAVGEDMSGARRETSASGVMMIPIPASGVYHEATGVEEARAVAGVTDVIITAKRGQRLLQLPEGSSYLGFIFARGETPDEVQSGLRASHSRLRFEIMKELPAL